MTKQITLRLPDELHERLKEAAEHNRRSLHAEILWRLEHDQEQER
jgi:predicted DNA-binding protein